MGIRDLCAIGDRLAVDIQRTIARLRKIIVPVRARQALMTSLDKLAKMDGWDVSEDDTGAYQKSGFTRTSGMLQLILRFALYAPTLVGGRIERTLHIVYTSTCRIICST